MPKQLNAPRTNSRDAWAISLLRPAFEAALKLEVLGRDGILSEAESAYAGLETEITRVKSAMTHLGNLEAGPEINDRENLK